MFYLLAHCVNCGELHLQKTEGTSYDWCVTCAAIIREHSPPELHRRLEARKIAMGNFAGDSALTFNN